MTDSGEVIEVIVEAFDLLWSNRIKLKENVLSQLELRENLAEYPDSQLVTPFSGMLKMPWTFDGKKLTEDEREKMFNLMVFVLLFDYPKSKSSSKSR